MYELTAENEKIAYELDEVVKAFYPDEAEAPHTVVQKSFVKDGIMRVDIAVDENTFSYEKKIGGNISSDEKRFYNRFNKLCLYKSLEQFSERSLPWGSLTGIRPTKLAYELIDGGKSIEEAARVLQTVYCVSSEKAELIEKILKAQDGYIRKGDNLFNLYVHIPFCVSKCSYCSFVTDVLTPSYKYTQRYVEALTEEIERTKNALKVAGGEIVSVYIGGGTPTALDETQLKKVLTAAYCGNVEYTCEAGRPDTITEEKLSVIADCGVGRICVNPQSLCDETLKRIGRNHDSRKFFEAYEAARKYPFVINTDLIAGLEGETAAEFSQTLKGITDLRPENITVHTLARKNGSELSRLKYRANAEVEKMVKLANAEMKEHGYIPYYTYRQKRMLGNLENTGYCLDGTQCVNNITTMEECIGVAACGAGAINKRVYDMGGRIERLANLRDVKLYLEQFEERLNKKLIFLS